MQFPQPAANGFDVSIPHPAGCDLTSGLLQCAALVHNIHHGEGVDRKLDLPRIAGVIKSVKPDLVALQEGDQGTERTKTKPRSWHA